MGRHTVTHIQYLTREFQEWLGREHAIVCVPRHRSHSSNRPCEMPLHLLKYPATERHLQRTYNSK